MRNGANNPDETVRKFPYRLHDLLSAVERDGTLDHVISWQPHGRSFKIHDPKEFASAVLSRYYEKDKAKTPKFSSFLRNLNLWGFVRLYKDMDKGCYYHEFFVRGHKSLCLNIQRKSVNGNKVRRKASNSDEPNFYGKDRHQFCYFDEKIRDENGAKRNPIRLPMQYYPEAPTPPHLPIPQAIISPMSSNPGTTDSNIDTAYPFCPEYYNSPFDFKPQQGVESSNDTNCMQKDMVHEDRDTPPSFPFSNSRNENRDQCDLDLDCYMDHDTDMLDLNHDEIAVNNNNEIQMYEECTPIRFQATEQSEISFRSTSSDDTTNSWEMMNGDCFGPEEVKTLLNVLF